jgi:hypothetical protein
VSNSTSRPRPERWGPLALPGDRRTQEANRKRVLRGLSRFERVNLSKARKAADLVVALSEHDLDSIIRGDRSTRKLLNEAFQLDECRDGSLCVSVRRLIGAGSDYVADQVLRAGRDRADVITERERYVDDWKSSSAAPYKVEPLGSDAATDLSAEAALTEAKRIVAQASDNALDEIDWTSEPRSDRERALRKAIIARIEVEGTARSPFYVTNCLCDLTDDPWGDDLASDLAQAIDRWICRSGEENDDRNRKERRRLLEAARRDLDVGVSPPDAA